MNGFLPLVEAFLAFALTMLALATAVSAIVGVWMRAFRWRALGLRQSLELIYDREIRPRLSTAAGRTADSSDRLGFIADLTFGLTIEPGPQDLAEPGAEQVAATDRRTAELAAYRRRPEPEDTPKRLLSLLIRRFRRWRSLRFGVDYLTESQFQVRLDASEAGGVLARHYGEDEWSRLRPYLTQVFTEVGETATESFARRSRVRTVIAGLVLALGVNIDSFNLLNTYMTGPEIRRGVIAQQERIPRQGPPDQADGQALEGGLTGFTGRVDATMGQIEQRLSDLAAAGPRDAQAQQTLKRLEGLLGEVRSDLIAVAQTKGEVTAAVSAPRDIATQLTKSFPIGWDGYPNCYAAALDGRCARVEARAPGVTKQATDFYDRLASVARADTAGFLKWFIGVLLTGFMVGLGAPFWVQTVNRMLKLKDRLTDTPAGAPEPDTAPVSAPEQANGRTGRGGRVARASADHAPTGRAAAPQGSRPAASSLGRRARKTADERLANREPSLAPPTGDP